MRVLCDHCKNLTIVMNFEEAREKICTCNCFLCSEKCEREHNSGHTIKEMKELEGHETIV
jgi:hypothetical protein